MNRLLVAMTALAAQLVLVAGAAAQTTAGAPPARGGGQGAAAAAGEAYPADVKVQKGPDGFVFADAQGHFLYAAATVNQRFGGGQQGGQGQGGGQRAAGQGAAGQGAAALAAAAGYPGQGTGPRAGGPNAAPPSCNGSCPADYCADHCAAEWKPLAAPADALPVGRWRVMKGDEGPQWTFNNAYVFVPRNGVKKEAKADARAGDAVGGAFDLGGDEFWKKLPYTPPVPAVTAPIGIKPVYVASAYSYVLVDAKGHALFSAKGGACKTCTDWAPLGAGAAAQGVGDWSVSRDGDRPLWLFRGKPVYVSQEAKPTDVPAAGIALRP